MPHLIEDNQKEIQYLIGRVNDLTKLVMCMDRIASNPREKRERSPVNRGQFQEKDNRSVFIANIGPKYDNVWIRNKFSDMYGPVIKVFTKETEEEGAFTWGVVEFQTLDGCKRCKDQTLILEEDYGFTIKAYQHKRPKWQQ